MKILLVHQGAELYGSDKTFLQSVKAYRIKYPEAWIVVSIPCDGSLVEKMRPYVDEFDFGRVWVLRKSTVKKLFGKEGLSFIRLMISAWKFMRKFDHVYLNTLVVFNFLCARFFLPSKGSVVHVHEIQTGKLRYVFSVILSLSRAQVIFNSIATQKTYSLLFWQSKRVVPNGVSPAEIFTDLDPEHTYLRCLMVGRVNDWKGQDLLLNAIADLDENLIVNVELRIIGDVFEGQDHFREQLLNTINVMSIKNQIVFEGFTEDTSGLYNWADVVFVPSKKPEPFGLVAIEAMSHSKCVVAAGHGGLVEIVDNGITGVLFEPNNKEALSEVIKGFIIGRLDYKKMGKKGLSKYESFYTEKRYLDLVVGVINE